jgi:sporulation protein YlmC with PRC-barrel domain
MAAAIRQHPAHDVNFSHGPAEPRSPVAVDPERVGGRPARRHHDTEEKAMQNVLLTAGAVIALSAGAAAAQTTTTQPSQAGTTGQADRQVAEGCLDQLEQMRARMTEEGFWLTGWRYGTGAGTGAPISGPAGAGTAAAPPPAVGTDAQPAAGPEATAADTDTSGATYPWGSPGWTISPSYEMRTLYGAAYVLAQKGDEQGCNAVVASLEDSYNSYAGQLREAGVDPEEVSGWRVQQLAAAVPVGELGNVRLDNVTGTDIRNLQDENLGSVEDVVIDPQSGEIAYLIVARGGFLGIGQDHVAVPWQRLKATPGLSTFVLEVEEDQFAQAPEVEPRQFNTQEGLDARREEIDAFWQG